MLWSVALRNSPPRTVTPRRHGRNPAVIFTKRFCDAMVGGRSGFGAVLLDTTTTTTRTFETLGMFVAPEEEKKLQADAGAAQMVGQAELLAVVAAKEKLNHLLPSQMGTARLRHQSGSLPSIGGATCAMAAPLGLAELPLQAIRLTTQAAWSSTGWTTLRWVGSRLSTGWTSSQVTALAVQGWGHERSELYGPKEAHVVCWMWGLGWCGRQSECVVSRVLGVHAA